MNYQDMASWFSWKGRANRQPFIFATLVFGGLGAVVQQLPDEATVVDLFFLPLFLLIFYIWVVLGIKRAHDVGRSGFFVLLLFIPLIAIWPSIDLLFFRGTSGPNKYGEDPLW